MDKKRYFETEWPWLKDGTWDASVFQQLVRTPLQSTPETSLFSQCCHLATALKLLERGLFCFSGTHHSFWEDNCIPDVNFFTRFHAGEAAVSWLESGSTLPFLQSLCQLSTLCLEASKRVFGEATIVENPFKVKCVQSLATTLSADSLLAFPLIPKQMRNYLSNFIDFLTATDINPVRHLEYYSTFIQFLIFFMACPDKKINDKPIPHLKNLNIQWGELFGEVSREHWNVILYVEENPPPYTKENYFRYEGRRMARFAALTREFTRTCVTVSSGSRGEVVASLLSRDMEGMLESLCGITGVAKYISHRCFIFDCLVWYLCPIAVIQAFYQEKIQNNDREAAALLAAADWRLIVRCCLTIARLRDRSLMEKKKAGKSVQAEETAAAIQQLVSEKCNAWLQTDRIVESEELISQPTDGTDEAAWSSAIRLSILNSPLWTTKAEVTAVREGVYGVLAQPQGSAEKEDLFDLIAFLAGTVKDGSATLPRSLNQIAHEFLIQSLGLRNFL
ncbi:hypothetical protein ADEAN_000061800 [Angomonas deanei]|uniref:Uncharacterized protein n=1 Tax=Angomonas deanei TaxID=59799 RepID=A0A7G2C5H6_9TRYP|nr:hypothetical protein ADEAN_000061800 [Angomonas deanei]